MNSFFPAILSLLIPITAFAEDQQAVEVFSTCEIRSRTSKRADATVKHSWKITATTGEDRVLSIEHLTREPKDGLRGTQFFEYCRPGNTHEQEIILHSGDAPDEGGRSAGWADCLKTAIERFRSLHPPMCQ